jgi:hypothetical protein
VELGLRGQQKEAREGLMLDGLIEHFGARGETEVRYELVVHPPQRAVVQ